MTILISELWITQGKLRNPQQISTMMKELEAGGYLPFIQIDEMGDGSLEVADGHHRLTAHHLTGRTTLRPEDYELRLSRENPRPKRRRGKITDAPWLAHLTA